MGFSWVALLYNGNGKPYGHILLGRVIDEKNSKLPKISVISKILARYGESIEHYFDEGNQYIDEYNEKGLIKVYGEKD